MSLRKAVLILLIFLIPISVFANDAIVKLDYLGLPSKEYSYYLMQSNPDLVWSMIRKLYAIEQSTPELIFPTLLIIEDKKDQLTIGYLNNDPVQLVIGTGDYSIQYEFTLKNMIIEGYKPTENYNTIFYVGGIFLAIVGGFVVGQLAH